MTNNTELITNIANLALALSFIVALIFGIVQVKTAARDRKEHFALDILRNFQSREFIELMQFMDRREMPKSYDDLKKFPDNEGLLIVQFSQQMESLGMMVAEKYINIDLVDKTLGVFVSNSWEKLKPMITDLRKEQTDPYLNEYFQWLAEKMDERMKNKPRKPFNER